MPSFEVVTSPLSAADVGLVAVGVFAPASDERTDPVELADDAQEVARASGIELVAELTALGFDGACGSVARVPTRGALTAGTIAVVGLGKRAEVDAARLRRAGVALAGAAERSATMATGLATAVPDIDPLTATKAVVEGLELGAYRFSGYQSDPPPFALEQVAVHVADDVLADARSGLEVARVTAAATLLTRDLVNTPPQDKRPPALAARAVAEVADLPISARVLDEAALADGGYGGILGVGQGSSEPPRLVELTYSPEAAASHVALVGKGITFDTGGISLKPSTAMETMKMDMAGAATVLAVVKAAAQLELPVKVTALLALAENMPSGGATRVSDVLTMRGGTTVEVINTDAEGRLVLGDALAHASELGPDVIIDVATLTGAAVIALGERIGVLMASDDDLADGLLDASVAAGEPLWRLPLAQAEYGDRLEGAIADLKNAGSRAAGTIFAGLFLHRFVGEGIAWGHLDVAGTAWSDDAIAELPKGGTGVPARTLVEWLRSR